MKSSTRSTMKTPVIGGKISTPKTEQASASPAAAIARGGATVMGGAVADKDRAGQTFKAIGDLGKRQSESLMDVTSLRNSIGKTGSGNRLDSVVETLVVPAEVHAQPFASPQSLGNSPRLFNSRRNTMDRPSVNGNANLLDLSNSMSNSPEDDIQVIDQRYEDYFRKKGGDGKDIFTRMQDGGNTNCIGLKRLFRKMGCGTSQMTHVDDPLPVVVIGATGTVGGAVARALLRDHRFTVRAVTRTPSTDQARALAEEGAVVVAADLNDTRSLSRAMEGAAGVFMTTNFWEHLSKQREIAHGMNAVDAAVQSNVHHFIMHGSDPTDPDDPKCGYMDAKAAIEVYLRESTMPFTVVKLPFLYENLLTFFKPHLINPATYTLPIPMESKPLDVMALQDVAHCVVNIFLRPKNHMFRSVALSGERMTVHHMADVLNKVFDDRTVTYIKITPDDFATFDFQGSQDIAAMFAYLQKAPARDSRISRRIYHSVTIFDRWAHDNKDKLLAAMNGDEDASTT